jgi:hypothetical protein
MHTAIEVRWENDEKTVLRQHFRSHWTLVDYDDSIRQLWAMIGEVDHTVHIITDSQHSISHVSALILDHFRWALDTMPKNVGLMVIVADNHCKAAVLFDLVVQHRREVARRTVRVTTLDEARRAIDVRRGLFDGSDNHRSG